MKKNKKEVSYTNEQTCGGLDLLVRLFWMVIGNAVLFLSAMGIWKSEKPGFNIKDAIYWTTVLLLISARYIDIKYLHGSTAFNTPATMSHFYRYSIGLVVCAMLVWGLVCFV